MLDLKYVVENREAVLAMLASRGQGLEDVQAFLEEIERLENELPPDLREQQLDLLQAERAKKPG